MITFEQAHDLLREARNYKRGKPIYSLPHTRVMLTQGTIDDPQIISIRYYDTNIVNLHSNGTYLAKTCNWNTRTTKKRINTLTPLNVSQKRGVWYHNGLPFYSGIMVDASGNVLEENSVMAD